MDERVRNIAIISAAVLVVAGLVYFLTSHSLPPDPSIPPGQSLKNPLGTALRRGIAVLERGRLPAAAQTFERAVRRDPRAPLARDYLGIAYLRMRRYADALRQFREESRLDPVPATAWARVADVYHAQGRDRE